MKKLLIVIGVICYCVAPDLFVGPADDAALLLASMIYSLSTSGERKEPEYVKAYRDF